MQQPSDTHAAGPADSPADSPATRRGSYAVVIAVYLSAVGGTALLARRNGVRLPDRLRVQDLVVAALATQRIARLVAKDPVTSPVRAPFTEFVGVEGPAELEERARDDSHLRHTVGELLSCPFCLGQWIGTALMAGHVIVPRAARLVASTFAVIGVADALQHVTAKLRDD